MKSPAFYLLEVLFCSGLLLVSIMAVLASRFA